jgi:hypothetical protein
VIEAEQVTGLVRSDGLQVVAIIFANGFAEFS